MSLIAWIVAAVVGSRDRMRLGMLPRPHRCGEPYGVSARSVVKEASCAILSDRYRHCARCLGRLRGDCVLARRLAGFAARAPHTTTHRAFGPETGRVRELTAMAELFTIYTRLAFGATMILAAMCVLLELIGGAL